MTPEVIIFTPTPNEFAAVHRHVSGRVFDNFTVRVVECGMGKINAAFQVAAEVLPLLKEGRKPLCLIGAGTCGSLNLGLAGGEVIVSNEAVIADWRLEDETTRHCAPYGDINFRPVEPALAEEMAIACQAPWVVETVKRLEGAGFRRGRMLTSDTFVSGKQNKLNLGRQFGCLACDMESAAFGYVANIRLGAIPWFTLRVVADTLDESLADYSDMEVDMVDVLGGKVVEALCVVDLHSQ